MTETRIRAIFREELEKWAKEKLPAEISRKVDIPIALIEEVLLESVRDAEISIGEV